MAEFDSIVVRTFFTNVNQFICWCWAFNIIIKVVPQLSLQLTNHVITIVIAVIATCFALVPEMS